MTIEALIDFFHGLSPQSVARFPEFYSADAYFKDPFNEVRGLAPIRRIFAHMFETLDAPRFIVKDIAVDGDACWLAWDFVFHNRRMGDERQCIHGASLLRLGSDGRITDHRDYWDAAEELYEKLPLIGAVMRWLRRRITSS